ncbi:MAG: cytochrome c [Bacteroidetes bacterium]|nr:cytochrome c [Bacteroidota bacterium]
MKKLLKFLKWTGIVLGTVIVLLLTFVLLTWDKKYDAPYPDITASKDSAVIARGKYLANGPAHCGICHTPMDKIMAVENNKEASDFSGGWELSFPSFGTFRAPNITPDMETGIGKRTDKELARSLRHMVGYDGRMLAPFMTFQELTDEDLTAVISYLRSLKPVKHEVKGMEAGIFLKALLAFGMMKPEGPKNTPAKSIAIDSTVEYGKYMAWSVCNCRTCHTQMDVNTGKFVGKDFAGKGAFEPDAFSKGHSYLSPNLTPHKGTGVIANWDKAAFLQRFRAGRVHEGSPMPWGSFTKINDLELTALYKYLRSLEPVDNKVEKTVFAPGEKMPEL